MCMYLCEMILTIFCLYFIHIDNGYECIVLSCIAEGFCKVKQLKKKRVNYRSGFMGRGRGLTRKIKQNGPKIAIYH